MDCGAGGNHHRAKNVDLAGPDAFEPVPRAWSGKEGWIHWSNAGEFAFMGDTLTCQTDARHGVKTYFGFPEHFPSAV